MSQVNLIEYGIVIAGHGSRDSEGVQEFESLMQIVKQRSMGHPVSHGFLEFARPTIDEAIREHIQVGIKRITVVPGVLLAATHAKNDMPSEVQALRREFPDVQIDFGAPLHLHPLVLQLIQRKIIETESKSKRVLKRSETCLVVVGRGTTDPDANSDVSKLARMVEEGMGFGASMVCYSGTAKPSIADGLQLAGRLGFSRMVVIPFFLFTGVLVKRILSATEEFRDRTSGVEVLSCDYLGVHESIADAFLQRAAESIEGQAAMNCGLCKYRVAIVGYENEKGAPQQGHHFHVRAARTSSSEESIKPIETPTSQGIKKGYETHPIEVESFEIIDRGRDWSMFKQPERDLLQRLVHTSGDFAIVDDIYISPGAVEAGLKALSTRSLIVTDVTMVQSGLRRTLLEKFDISTRCHVHDEETRLMAEASGITRSAAGIRRAWMQYGNNLILAIGDAPTAVEETVRLINEQRWRPYLVIGLPVGFVGTAECKENLRRCLHVPRITNHGTRGGSPWAAAVINAMLIRLAREVL